MISNTTRSITLALCALLAVACDSGMPERCVPGMSVACVGPGGCDGAQVCLDDATGFADCVCSTDMDSGPPDADGGPEVDSGVADDAGGMDATVSSDGGGSDGGGVDGGGVDGGSDAGVDGGAPDAGFDAGRPDAGPPDAGSAGCFPGCGLTQRCCGSTCVNRSVPIGTDGRSDSSFRNCNGCGISCSVDRASACSGPTSGATPRCMCGTFDQCRPSEVCVFDGAGFGCTNLLTDANNCGTIGNVCPMGEACVGGMCRCGSTGASCGAGSACCGGGCVPTAADPMNCGGCGVVCGANAPNCVAGTCQCGTNPACVPPALLGGLGESCCSGTCVANTDSSCGCGVSCTSPDACVVDLGILGGSGGVCCGTPSPFGGLCSTP